MDANDKKPEEYWKKKLTPQQYKVLRERGTEAPFTGKYHDHHEAGMYECAACGHPLFSSDAKFDSGTGWPSFDAPMNRENVELREDTSHGMRRTEVICKNCGSHLGHVFEDGPSFRPSGSAGQAKQATGQRYCINSCALEFKKAHE